ncbi:CRISPR-associated protein Cas4 [Carboxydocella sp. JDF658]|uniref:CRISPR-associated protein Cas4 n=1 Tax=Carboxydocella sp. JDF658 TaxID=1926600 RepID=UPI0009AE0A26|nr:CRISPR-associated protein Cas4 [Carboxydocella sp. JDF658]AVX29686.1 CRISPR-associated exonuclease, Cas4 family [Carboxydocella thermautotrophica]GAW30341.1 CRISPR-associated protein Cas4 [Carboxydocella sp. JDF658]
MQNYLMELELGGLEINYYFVCKRKLWLYSRYIRQETNHDRVELGQFIHEESYRRQKKEIEIGSIKVDLLQDGAICEIKLSSRMEEAHLWQLYYYLYYLKKQGFNQVKGVLLFPKERRKKEVILTQEVEKELKKIIAQIITIKKEELPPEKLNKRSFCTKCAYFEFCYA